MLSITREEFRTIYAACPTILAQEEIFYSKPKDEADLQLNYLPSKLWRLNNLYKIIDKHGNKIRFVMNKAQHVVYAASIVHPRLIILKSRQQGISTFWLINFFDDALTRKNYNIGLMAQGADEASTLLERTKMLWDELQDTVKKYLNISVIVDNTKEYKLSNKASIFIRTSFRSATLQRLHISEMGKIANSNPKKASETKSGTLQALAQGNIGVIESTGEGDNLFKNMWDNAVLFEHDMTPKDFKPVFLSWLDDPDCNIEKDQYINAHAEKYFEQLTKDTGRELTRTQKNFWVVQYRELGDRTYQEYPATPTEAFMKTREGAYWAHLYMQYVKLNKREYKGLYDKNLDVQLSVDLGMNDTNVLVPFQKFGEEHRVIGEFFDNGQDIAYYCDWIKKQPWFRNLRHVILPHDAEVKELTSGMTRHEAFEEELKYYEDGTETGIYFTVLPRVSKNEGIQAVRVALKKLAIDQVCEYLIKCFVNYSKEWDEKREVFRDKPEHDEYSNGADAIRYMVMGAQTQTKPNRSNKRAGRNDYDGQNNRRQRRGFEV